MVLVIIRFTPCLELFDVVTVGLSVFEPIDSTPDALLVSDLRTGRSRPRLAVLRIVTQPDVRLLAVGVEVGVARDRPLEVGVGDVVALSPGGCQALAQLVDALAVDIEEPPQLVVVQGGDQLWAVAVSAPGEGVQVFGVDVGPSLERQEALEVRFREFGRESGTACPLVQQRGEFTLERLVAVQILPPQVGPADVGIVRNRLVDPLVDPVRDVVDIDVGVITRPGESAGIRTR